MLEKYVEKCPDVLKMLASGMIQTEIAKKLGIPEGSFYRIKNHCLALALEAAGIKKGRPSIEDLQSLRASIYVLSKELLEIYLRIGDAKIRESVIAVVRKMIEFLEKTEVVG